MNQGRRVKEAKRKTVLRRREWSEGIKSIQRLSNKVLRGSPWPGSWERSSGWWSDHCEGRGHTSSASVKGLLLEDVGEGRCMSFLWRHLDSYSQPISLQQLQSLLLFISLPLSIINLNQAGVEFALNLTPPTLLLPSCSFLTLWGVAASPLKGG